MAVRISDIARKAGVAKGTVSLVLNRKCSGVRISKETEQRILQTAKEMNYQPSFAARALARGKTKTIGILVNSVSNNFYSAFFKYLNDVCYKSGYSVFFTTSEFDLDRERRILEFFQNRLADGVIINRLTSESNDLIQTLIDQGIPVVIEGEMGPAPFPLVGFDEFKVADLTAEHLWSLGHRRVLHFSAEQSKDQSRVFHHHRRNNFLAAWNRISNNMPLHEFSTEDPDNGGNELAEHLKNMPAKDMPTAIVCSADRLALSLMSGLKTSTIRIPQDISIIGCDDITSASEAVIPLTTIRLPVEKIAQQIWDLLSRMLQTSSTTFGDGPAPSILIEPELIVRESTGECHDASRR